MGYETMGAPRSIGSLDMTRIARWLGNPSLSALQKQARLAAYSVMCTIARSAWKKLNLMHLVNDTRHKIKSKTLITNKNLRKL